MHSWITHFALVFKKDLRVNVSSGDLQIVFVVVGIMEYVGKVKDKRFLTWN